MTVRLQTQRPDLEPLGAADLARFRGLSTEPGVRRYATEAPWAVMRDAVSRLGLRVVVASTDVPNVASIRVMQRLGMELLRRETIGGLDTGFYRIAASAIPSE